MAGIERGNGKITQPLKRIPRLVYPTGEKNPNEFGRSQATHGWHSAL